jgi:hypothetical protein
MAETRPTPAERTRRTAERPPIALGSVELLEETIVPSPNVVELRRTATSDYVFRFAATTPHPAELFHENSRITPHSEQNVVIDEEALVGARKWFYGTAYRPREDTLDEAAARARGLMVDARELVPRAGGGLLRLLEPDVPELTYALDFLLLDGDRIYRLAPGADVLWLERRYAAPRLPAIREALPELEDEDGVLLFVLGVPWRYMALQGPRGYRRTLIEAGRVLQALEDAASRDGSELQVSLDFYDARLDDALRVDGVERATLAAVAMRAAEHRPDEEDM